jgi:hypothetical protein
MKVHLKERLVSMMIEFVINHETTPDEQLEEEFFEFERQIKTMVKYYVVRKEFSSKEVEETLDQMRDLGLLKEGLAKFPKDVQNKFVKGFHRVLTRTRNWAHILRYWS